METKSNLKNWFQQIRGPFLILSVALVAIGVGAAYQQGYIHLGFTALVLAGVLFFSHFREFI